MRTTQGSLTAAALAVLASAPSAAAFPKFLRFSCSELVTERLDPIVFPGVPQSPHLHQIAGGNMFNVTMDPSRHDISSEASCTTCTFAEDFSNYWTATLFFRARNGSYMAVPKRANLDFDGARGGGMSVYYTPYRNVAVNVTAFAPGFRMTVGNPAFRTRAEGEAYRGLTFTCLDTMWTRTGETMHMPRRMCKEGIMANHRFPTCWDGVHLDSEDHQSHVAYPVNGTFADDADCPASHPVRIPELFYEVIWDTRGFNDAELWPEDGSQPFVWSFGDFTGYGTHADYVFGWKGDALQRAMDANCDFEVECEELVTQSIEAGNQCRLEQNVPEDFAGWLESLPGGVEVTGPQPGDGSACSEGGTCDDDWEGPCEVVKWGQCGGTNWTGCTTCTPGTTCQFYTEDMDLCL
ncbi:hypothetical protein VTI74DRAFT_8369 [Chaetomium olivicolor]